MTVTKSFEIVNSLGMHARPSASFVKLANKFDSSIFVECGDNKVNGKSILGLMMLGAGKGNTLNITAEGDDAHAAIDKLGELITDGFYE